MGIQELVKVSTLFARLSRQSDRPAARPRVIQRHRIRRDTGLMYDIFEPQQESRSTLIALHGASPCGKNDRRLQHLARCLALSRVTCVTPHLPGLAELQWSPSDVDKLVELIQHLIGQQKRRLGLVGFSHGASYALLAAARGEVSSSIRFVVSFGAYHSFPELYRHFLEGSTPPRTKAEWDNWLFLKSVQVFRQRERLGLDPLLMRELKDFLMRYGQLKDLRKKKQFYDTRLKDLDAARLDYDTTDPSALEALSPNGKLSALSCPVILIHDPRDNLVPSVHAQRIYDELERLPNADRHRLLITRLMTHVNLGSAARPVEVVKLLSYLSCLVEPEAAPDQA